MPGAAPHKRAQSRPAPLLSVSSASGAAVPETSTSTSNGSGASASAPLVEDKQALKSWRFPAQPSPVPDRQTLEQQDYHQRAEQLQRTPSSSSTATTSGFTGSPQNHHTRGTSSVMHARIPSAAAGGANMPPTSANNAAGFNKQVDVRSSPSSSSRAFSKLVNGSASPLSASKSYPPSVPSALSGEPTIASNKSLSSSSSKPRSLFRVAYNCTLLFAVFVFFSALTGRGYHGSKSGPGGALANYSARAYPADIHQPHGDTSHDIGDDLIPDSPNDRHLDDDHITHHHAGQGEDALFDAHEHIKAPPERHHHVGGVPLHDDDYPAQPGDLAPEEDDFAADTPPRDAQDAAADLEGAREESDEEASFGDASFGDGAGAPIDDGIDLGDGDVEAQDDEDEEDDDDGEEGDSFAIVRKPPTGPPLHIVEDGDEDEAPRWGRPPVDLAAMKRDRERLAQQRERWLAQLQAQDEGPHDDADDE